MKNSWVVWIRNKGLKFGILTNFHPAVFGIKFDEALHCVDYFVLKETLVQLIKPIWLESLKKDIVFGLVNAMMFYVYMLAWTQMLNLCSNCE